MKRKPTAIIFMYMAYLIIMAHAVIPHHHHASQVCIQSIEHSNTDCSHGESAQEHSAHEDCKLTQSVLLPPDDHALQKFNYPSHEIPGLLSNIEVDPLITDIRPMDLTVDDLNSYLHFRSKAHILRAPPTA